MPRLSEAQRRAMAYLTSAHGNRIEPHGRTYAIVVPNGEWRVGPTVTNATLVKLVDLGLVEFNGKHYVPTARAWALAHKGGLR